MAFFCRTQYGSWTLSRNSLFLSIHITVSKYLFQSSYKLLCGGQWAKNVFLLEWFLGIWEKLFLHRLWSLLNPRKTSQAFSELFFCSFWHLATTLETFSMKYLSFQRFLQPFEMSWEKKYFVLESQHRHEIECSLMCKHPEINICW